MRPQTFTQLAQLALVEIQAVDAIVDLARVSAEHKVVKNPAKTAAVNARLFMAKRAALQAAN